jgi:CTP synthase (UTP-ammonia lyase)
MQEHVRIAIIGDFNPASPTHVPTNDALSHAAAALDHTVDIAWIPTEDLEGPAAERRLDDADGIWASPGSPYKSMNGALNGIRFARERGRPFVGT